MAIYYIADLHLGHANVIHFDNRPFINVQEMEEVIISNWNNRVHQNDIVYVLGDFAWSKESMWLPILAKFKGQINLIRGNHDPKVFTSSTKRLLHDIKDYKEISDSGRQVIMCHYPIPFYKSANKDHYYMLYGHVHNTRENAFLEKWKKEVADSCSEFGHSKAHFINVGCMMPWMDYTPRTLDEIIEGEQMYMRQEN
ncbi:MAG: metallophosphoesterase family protein [Bacillota bacterium]|nr:metallophosphoesterase family protein [Bacillota bacterium]